MAASRKPAAMEANVHLHLDPAARPLPASTRDLTRARWTVCQPYSMEPRFEPVRCSQAERSGRVTRFLMSAVTVAIGAMIVLGTGEGL